MDSQFGESSYGFAVIGEIVDKAWSHLLEVPILPSTREEGRLGWDAEFRLNGVSLFLQFKTSTRLQDRRARFWDWLKTPYFSFSVYKPQESLQHNLLVELAQKEDNVRYCAPLFYESQRFNTVFFNKEVLRNSVWIDARNLPILDLDDTHRHKILFTEAPRLFFATDPIPVDGISNAKESLDSLLLQLERAQPPVIDLSSLRALWETISEIAARIGPRRMLTLLDVSLDRQEPLSVVRAIRQVLSSIYGVVWLVLTQPPTDVQESGRVR